MIRETDSSNPIQDDLDYIILPKTHSSMYLMHRYWARKPANIISEYIKKYTDPQDIVLDPFMGSGVTVIESLFLNRKSIGVDVNPISQFICRNTVQPVDLLLFKEAFAHLQAKIISPDSLYSQINQTKCVQCKSHAIITHIIWKLIKVNNDTEPTQMKDFNSDLDITPSKRKINEIRLDCPSCGKIVLSRTNQLNNFQNIVKSAIMQEEMALQVLKNFKLSPPAFSFRYNNFQPFLQLRHDLRKNPYLNNLFSNRNLAVLTYIKDCIIHLPKKFEKIKDLMKFCFSSAIGQSSKMVWVINKRKGVKLRSPQVGSWTHHFFWDPTEYFEVNAWNCFKNRFDKVLRGKTEVNNRFKSLSRCSIDRFQISSSFSQLEISPHSPLCLLNISSKSLPIPSESIDFIFTDPPYGDSIQYGELATLWARWLDFDMKSYINSIEQDEIIINKSQKKDLKRYSKQLLEVFTELYRVLKPLKFLVLTFHNNSIKVRNSLIEQAIRSGFSLRQILFQLPPRASIKSLLHHSGTPIGDYFIRFQKSGPKVPQELQDNLFNRYGQVYDLWDPQFLDPTLQSPDSVTILAQIKSIMEEILMKRAEPTLHIWVLNLLDELLFKANLFPLPDVEIYLQKLVETKEFVVDSNKYWWFSPEVTPNLDYASLTSRIESFLLKFIPTINFRGISQTKKQYLFNEVYSKFRGILTPDKFIINQLVERILQKI